MNKRMIFLVVLCIGISVAGGLILLYEFSAIETSITEINSNPSAWVNRKVVVEGKLVGPLGYIPETTPPWNYELYGLNETVETVGKPETVHIGILWNREVIMHLRM